MGLLNRLFGLGKRTRADDNEQYVTRFETGEYDQAIVDFTEAIRLNPNDAEAYALRGLAYAGKGDQAKAEVDLAKARGLGYQPPADQFGHSTTVFHTERDERGDERKPCGAVAEMGKSYEVELTFPEDWTFDWEPEQITWFEGYCNVAVASIGEDLYRIDGFDADTGLGRNDVIEAEAKADGSLLFRRVVESNWRFYSYLMGGSDWIHSDYPEPIRKLLDKTTAIGGHWEHWMPGFLSFFIPKAITYDPSDDLDKALNSLPPHQERIERQPKVTPCRTTPKSTAPMDYAGLRFDGVYRTSSAIILDSDCGETLSLSLRFRRDLTVEYEFRVDKGSEPEDEDSGTTDYELPGQSRIRFSFDAAWWETEWQGTICAEQLQLTFSMKVYGGGPAAPLECVVEDEATLSFVPSASNA